SNSIVSTSRKSSVTIPLFLTGIWHQHLTRISKFRKHRRERVVGGRMYGKRRGAAARPLPVVRGFVGIGLPEKERLARAMQKACGSGGTIKEDQIEIQGDKR